MKGSWPPSLNLQQGGTTHRMTESMQLGRRQMIDRRLKIIGHTVPRELGLLGRRTRITMASKVESDDANVAGEFAREGCIYLSEEPAGVGNEQDLLAIASEVMEGDWADTAIDHC